MRQITYFKDYIFRYIAEIASQAKKFGCVSPEFGWIRLQLSKLKIQLEFAEIES